MRYPNLFIVGAPKCGTTTLYHSLSGHPEIFVPEQKEPFYFGHDYNRAYQSSESEYLNHYIGWSNEAYALDATVDYLSSETAAEEIRLKSPDARIIIMTRDPIEAAFSLYKFGRFIGRETAESFEEALQLESKRREITARPARGYRESLHYSRIYDFDSNIERFRKCFEHVHIMALEDLEASPQSEMDKLWDFLSLIPLQVGFTKKNEGNRVARFARLNDIMFTPPPWAGQVLFFVPKKVRKWMRNYATKVNSRQSNKDKLTLELRQMAQRYLRVKL